MASVDCIEMNKSNVPPEDQRRAIFLEYESNRKQWLHYGERKHADELSDYELKELGDIISGRVSAVDKLIQWQQKTDNSEVNAISHTTNMFGINERQLRAIIQEAENKKWR